MSIEFIVSAFRLNILIWLIYICVSLFAVVSFIIFFEAKKLSLQNLYEIFIAYDWEGAKHFYRYIISSSYPQSDMINAILHVYSIEYVLESLIPNIRYSLTALKV